MAAKSSKGGKSSKGKVKINNLKRGKSQVGSKGLKKIKGGTSNYNYLGHSYRDTLNAIQTSFPS